MQQYKQEKNFLNPDEVMMANEIAVGKIKSTFHAFF
jgi:hypothetical protein